MKSTFKIYQSKQKGEYDEIWNSSLIILDTNILLNLFRYPESVRKDFIKVLKHLKKQLWLPFIAGLEFHENLEYVTNSQTNAFNKIDQLLKKYTADLDDVTKDVFDEVRKLNLNKRHFNITEEDLIKTITIAFGKYKDELDKLSSSYSPSEEIVKRSINKIVSENEKQVRALYSIFNNRIGKHKSTQNEIDDLDKEAKKRYEQLIPPGYKDSSKGRDSKKKVLVHDNLVYKRECCDFYIWKEVVEMSAKLPRGLRNIIFVTDDLKEDWWRIVNGKTKGPRVELVDEIKNYAKDKLDNFVMYDSIRFLQFAISKYSIELKKETLPLIKDFQQLHNLGRDEHKTYLEICNAFEFWLKNIDEEYELMPRLKSNQFILKDECWDLNYYELFIRSSDLKDEENVLLNLKKRLDSGILSKYHTCTLVVVELSHREFVNNREKVFKMNVELARRLHVKHGYVEYDSVTNRLGILFN